MTSLKKENVGAKTEWLLDIAVRRDENMWRLAYKLIVIVVQFYIKL